MTKAPAVLLAALLVSALPAAAQNPAPPAAAPAASGRLGGGYKDAKWGMSPAEVKKRIPARVDYETRQPKVEKTLILSLGEGRKLSCFFENDRFFQAIYQPVAVDGEPTAAEAVVSGLSKKYGPGKEEDGFTDKEGKPLRLVTWNDGITKIEFRMRAPRPSGKNPNLAAEPYPSSTVTVLYTSIAVSAKRALRQDEERRRAEEQKRQQRVNDIQGDL
ncbi:MAG: hypothetical protein HY926_06835 [Elusimicrobia bacterium]|nr:hypothetical protein [Elusimicrobiota bacterium]